MQQSKVFAEPILMGREKELEILQHSLNSAKMSKGTIVFISGKTGTGKTRLIKEFLNPIKEQEITILYGWCLSNDAVPYFPFIEAFNSSLSSREGDTIVSQQLSKKSWTSKTDQFERLGLNDNLAPQVWKDQAFASVTRELLFMSSAKSLVLILEDMHWADSASLALLHYVSRAVVNEKILVLVTFRSEELGRDPEGRPHTLDETIHLMGRESLYKEIKLANLDRDGVRGIAESMLDGAVGLNFVEKLMKESHGNPLFVVEFLRMLSEQGNLVREKDKWQLSVDELGVPSKVRDVILRRIDGLKPDQRRVLDVASVIGDKFNPDLIGGVLSKDRLEILEILNDVLNSTSLVRVEENFYTFDHAKSREVIYEQISLPLKQGYHQRIGEQLEKSRQNGKEISFNDLAYHYTKAGNKQKSIKYVLSAGQDDLARFSNTEAIKHFNYVLESIANVDELAVEKNVALEGLGDAYAANCMYTEAIKTFDLLAESETGSLRLRALRKAMEAAFVKGDKPDLLLDYAKKAEELALDDPLEMGRIILNRGRAFAWAGQGNVNMDLAEYRAALQIFEAENSLNDVAEALWRIGEVCYSAEDLFEALGILLRSRTIFKELGNIRKELAVCRSIGIVYIFLGLFLEAKKELGNVLTIGEKLGAFNELARANGLLGLIDEYEGNFVDSVSKVLTALEYIKKTDVNYVQIIDLAALTRLYSKLGDLKRADEYFDKLTKLPPESLSTVMVRQAVALSKGVYFTAKNRFEDSNQIFTALVGLIEGSLFVTDFIWALEKQGNTKEAKFHSEKVQKRLEQNRKCFEHTNVQFNVMAPKTVQIEDVFEIHLDLVNVAKVHGQLVRIDGLIPSGSKVISLPSFCCMEKSSIKLNKKQIGPFQAKSIKIKIQLPKAGVYALEPCLHYNDSLGEPTTSKANQIALTVQFSSTEEKTKNVAKVIKSKLVFKSNSAEQAFDFLVNVFVEDYFRRRLPKERSGWRTLMDIAKQTKVSRYSLYGSSNHRGSAIMELEHMGVVEVRFFFGERGRGGKILKLRISFEKEAIKKHINHQL